MLRLGRHVRAERKVRRRAWRAQKFDDNVMLLHSNLLKVGWLERPEQSSFYRSDADFQTFIEQNCVLRSINKTNAKPEIHLKPQLSEETI